MTGTILPKSCERLNRLALRHPQRAVRIANQWYQQSVQQTLDRGWSSYTLGHCYLLWERAHVALPYLQEAQTIFAREQNQQALLVTEAALLKQQYLAGTQEDIQQPLVELAHQAEQSGHSYLAAQIRLIQIAHLNVLGHAAKALMECDRVRETIMAGTSLSDQAQLTRLAAMAWCDSGNVDRAAIELEQALAWFIHRREPAGIARCLFDRAWVNHRRERFEAALKDLDEAQETATRYQLEMRVAFCEKNRGAALTELGRYDEAFAASLKAWTFFLEIQRYDYAAGCDLNMGNIAYYTGLFELAELAYKRAQRVYQQYRMIRMERASLRNQALAQRAQGDSRHASIILETLRDITDPPLDMLELGEVYFELGRCYVQTDHYDIADSYFNKAEQVFLERQNLPGVAQCQLEQGWVQLLQGRVVDAEALFWKCRAALQEQPMHSWRMLFGLGRCAEEQNLHAQALLWYQGAAQIVVTLRHKLANEYASSAMLAQTQQLFTVGMRLALAQGDDDVLLLFIQQHHAISFAHHRDQSNYTTSPIIQQTLVTAQQQAIHALPDTEQEALQIYKEALLRVRHSQTVYREQSGFGSLQSLGMIRQYYTRLFGSDWTILIYATLDEELLIVILDGMTLRVERHTLTNDIRRALNRACTASYRAYTYLDLPYQNGSRTQPWSDLSLLGTHLVPQSVVQQLHAAHRLLIVPTGMLHALPWAALRLDNRWLCERCVPQLLPNLYGWPQSDEVQDGDDRALLVGISQFHDRAPALQNASDVLDVAQTHLMYPVTRLEGDLADYHTLAQLSQEGAAKQYRHLCFATHGVLHPKSGLLAHLLLADRNFYYDDIVQLQLNEALVVLVACDGAMGELLPGEEVLSLSRAFLAAGAREVIASLWPVYDNTVLDLLRPFYAALHAGNDAATALAQAQRHLIQDAAPSISTTSLPLVWAGMIAHTTYRSA